MGGQKKYLLPSRKVFNDFVRLAQSNSLFPHEKPNRISIAIFDDGEGIRYQMSMVRVDKDITHHVFDDGAYGISLNESQTPFSPLWRAFRNSVPEKTKRFIKTFILKAYMKREIAKRGGQNGKKDL